MSVDCCEMVRNTHWQRVIGHLKWRHGNNLKSFYQEISTPYDDTKSSLFKATLESSVLRLIRYHPQVIIQLQNCNVYELGVLCKSSVAIIVIASWR